MENLNVSFQDTRLSKHHSPDRAKQRQVLVNRAGDRWRVIAVDAGRYLLFYGESEPMADVPMEPIPNQLTESQDGQVRVIDGKTYTVAGFDGRAAIVVRRSDTEVLSQPAEGMHEIRVLSPEGVPAVIRKIGPRYQVFSCRNGGLFFFADAEVGPGFPTVILQNALELTDLGSKKIIDGVEYTVIGHGGEVKIEPEWFGSTRPLN